MDEMMELTPLQERRQHEAAMLSTLPMPKYKNIPSRELHLFEYINDLEGASEQRWMLYRDTWTPALAGVPVVHQEGETHYGVIDGRHRLLAVKFQPVVFHCAVFSGLTVEQIVSLFLFHNQHRRNPSTMERYHAAVMTGDPVA